MLFEQVSTRLPMDVSLYREIENTISASRFWEDDNTDPIFRSSNIYGGQFTQTDAARTLQLALDAFFHSKRLTVRVFVITIDSDDIADQTKAWQTNDRPNRFVVAASAELTKKKSDLLLVLSTVEASDDFDSKNVDPTAISRDIASTIRHELVHDSQYNQIAKSMGATRATAKQHMEDWNLIPAPGSSREKYLGSHIELDAFGHEFAERLASAFGVDKSLEALGSYSDGSLQKLAAQVDLGHNFGEFFSDNPDAAFTLTLVKKIKKYLLRFQHHGIYESTIKRKLRRLVREVVSGKSR